MMHDPSPPSRHDYCRDCRDERDEHTTRPMRTHPSRRRLRAIPRAVRDHHNESIGIAARRESRDTTRDTLFTHTTRTIKDAPRQGSIQVGRDVRPREPVRARARARLDARAATVERSRGGHRRAGKGARLGKHRRRRSEDPSRCVATDRSIDRDRSRDLASSECPKVCTSIVVKVDRTLQYVFFVLLVGCVSCRAGVSRIAIESLC